MMESVIIRLTSLPGAVLRGLTSILTLSVCIGVTSAFADTTGIFGPVQFTREAGPPQTFTATFERCGTAACELVVTNGNADGTRRVSSASILLNGQQLVPPHDFNQRVGEIVRPIQPGGDNEISVRLASNPGGFVTVEVRCPDSPVTLSVIGNGADIQDSLLLSVVRIANEGTENAENLQVTSLSLTDGVLSSPAMLPVGLGAVAPDDAATLNADFAGDFAPLGSHTLTIEGTYEAADATFCFALDADLEIPPGAPGSAVLGTASVPAQEISGAPFAPIPPQFDEEEANQPFWAVPVAPFVPGTPTETATGNVPAPMVAASASGLFTITPQDVPAVVFRANTGGINGGTTAGTSTTTEPSGASDADGVVFVTGNFFASYSTDGGGSFTAVNPTSVFPSDTVGFCCDQIVQYVPEIDRFIWLLQGSTSATRLGGYRLAAASPAALDSSGATAWTYWNLTPAVFGQPTGTAFDYPDMSVGNDYLYLSWDAGWPGCPSGCDKGFQVARVPLDQIEAASTINIGFTDPTLGTMAWGAHLAQNPADEIFWAGHNNNSEMRVFTLAEDSNTYFWRDVGISSWATGGLTSTTPDSQDWMNKLSGFPRHAPHGLTRNGSNMWLAWSAGSDDNFPRPHIEMVTLDGDFNVVQQVQIWNGDFSFGYPALSTNLCTREIGLSLEYGGNGRYENHAVGFWGDFLVYRTTSSDVGTTRYGDYVGIRREPPDFTDPGNLFAAFGYGLNSTAGGGTQVDVHYVSFGRHPSACQIIE